MWRSLLLVVLLACSSKREAKTSEVSKIERGITEKLADEQNAAETGARDILFVPAAIVNHLIGADQIFAIDLTRTDLSRLLALLPEEVGCAKKLL